MVRVSSFQVTSLTEFKPASEDGSTGPEATLSLHRRHFGSPQKLVQLVDKAVMNFVAVGEDIATENPEFQVGNQLSPTPLLLGAPN